MPEYKRYLDEMPGVPLQDVEIVIDASPEELLRAVVHNVEIRIVDPKKR